MENQCKFIYINSIALKIGLDRLVQSVGLRTSFLDSSDHIRKTKSHKANQKMNW